MSYDIVTSVNDPKVEINFLFHLAVIIYEDCIDSLVMMISFMTFVIYLTYHQIYIEVRPIKNLLLFVPSKYIDDYHVVENLSIATVPMPNATAELNFPTNVSSIKMLLNGSCSALLSR